MKFIGKFFQRKPEAAPVMVVQHAELTEAIRDLAGVFGDGMTAMHTGDKFTCAEADSIARVLLLAGHKDEALEWLSAHAEGDGVDDPHYTYDEDDPEDEGRVLNALEMREYAGWLAA
ncbi:hypothetical protein ACFYWP_01590 [Actinacidiphila glaucinigra]|uniref:hypothetical protein n=1 Tax=Actinacidiphila glaucinigra TaxID=235986 RepID=UPI003684C675